MKSIHYLNGKGEQYHFYVKVYTRPNLRGSESEMIMYMGKGHLEKMFDECKVDTETKSIHFEYPERWANILELRAIPDRIPTVFPNIERVTITTHSIYIIQNVHSCHIGIVESEGLFPEKDYGDLNTRYCPPPSNMDGLYMATPKEIIKVKINKSEI